MFLFRLRGDIIFRNLKMYLSSLRENFFFSVRIGMKCFVLFSWILGSVLFFYIEIDYVIVK